MLSNNTLALLRRRVKLIKRSLFVIDLNKTKEYPSCIIFSSSSHLERKTSGNVWFCSIQKFTIQQIIYHDYTLTYMNISILDTVLSFVSCDAQVKMTYLLLVLVHVFYWIGFITYLTIFLEISPCVTILLDKNILRDMTSLLLN